VELHHTSLFLAAGLGLYILAGRVVMRSLGGELRELVMALLNLAGIIYFVADLGLVSNLRLFLFYVLFVVLQYIVLGLCSDHPGRPRWPAFCAPLAVFIAFRYVPDRIFTGLDYLSGGHLPVPSAPVIGISYLAFRCSRLALEVLNGSVPRPGLWQYLNFAFFLPTMSVGPINTYANFRRGFEAVPWEVPAGRAVLRILVGLVKYQFLSEICNQLTYSSLLLNDYYHPWRDLPIAMVFYYLYLYCNFSGFCDMAIGGAALIGIPVPENFDRPFAARNLREFWNRWHITLSQWMRDIVFAPLAKFLVRVLGPARINHAVALAIFVVFVLIGIWHGVGWNFVIFGLLQALGVVANHYYTLGLKRWLGREGFQAYLENRWIHALAVVSTFAYFAASLLFFANTLPEIRDIFRVLR
jgi:D-alanyl-lipoteichoic acid acyltransferase DltB (MBOAT superfamily)